MSRLERGIATRKRRVHRRRANPGCAMAVPQKPFLQMAVLRRGVFVLGAWLAILFCPVLGETASLPVQEQTPASVPPKVAAIKIVGNQALSEEAIRQVMLTREASFFSFDKAEYVADRFDGDVERVVSLYRSAGYYDAEVDGRVIGQQGEDAVSLQLTVHEGLPVRIATFVIESPLWPSWLLTALGAGEDEQEGAAVKNAEEFSLLPLHEGDILDVEKYNEAKKELALLFADHGYARIEVQGSNNIFRQEHQADVRLVIVPGRQFMVGTLAIDGNEKVSDYLILREMKVQPGDLFSLSKIIESRHRLHDLDLFTSVSIEPDWTNETGNAVPLKIRVEEKPPRGIKLGAGYGTEDKIRALGQIRWRNFLKRGYAVRLTAKYSGLGHSLEAGFENPYLYGHPGLGLLYFLGYEHQELESYQNDQYYSRIRIDKKLTQNTSLFGGHNFESNDTSELSDSLMDTVLAKFGRVEEQNFLLSSLEVGGIFNSVDDPAYPTRGMSLSYGLEAASEMIGSEFEFLRQKMEWRGYYSPIGKAVLAFRATGGSVDPVHSVDYIPIAKRFFAGGSNSVRGYAYQDLGDKDLQGDPIGGYSLLETSAEFRFPLIEKLNGVLFIDGGNIFNDPYQFDVADLRYAGGFGFRYLTPVGPIRIDLAYKLNPETDEERRFRLHLNLGEAF